MRFDEADFTVFDLETTGLYPYAGDRICEIGALRVCRGGSSVIEFHALVDPRRPISPGAHRVNGITDSMVRGKPTIEAVLPDFLAFLKDSVLVAYNAPFDMGFLDHALGADARALDGYLVVDALKLARRCFPGLHRYNLDAVSLRLGIGRTATHRAVADARATLQVMERSFAILREEGVADINEIATRREAAARQPGSVERAIRNATSAGAAITITYFSMWNNSLTRRTITPRSIERSADASYVVAYCHLRNEVRHFRLDCVVDVWENDVAPRPSGETTARHVNA